MRLHVCVCVQDTLESLCELYSLLKEEDMFTAVWLKRARLPEVSLALTYEQHGFFEQAQLAYEQVSCLHPQLAYEQVCLFTPQLAYEQVSCLHLSLPMNR